MDPPPLAAPGADPLEFRGAASCVLAAEGVAPFPAALAFHPDDAMLRHLRRQGRGPEYACAEYVRSGLEAARCVRRTAAAVHGAAAGPWLDLAAGFGRVARFTARDLPAGTLDAADVLPGAAAFLGDVCGARVFESDVDPDAVRFPRRYRLIYVVSLFTHLPERRAAAWMRRLRDALDDGGVLLATTHGLAAARAEGEAPADASASYAYRRTSEIDALDLDEYGVAWWDPAAFRAALAAEGLPGAGTAERGLFGVHDVHVVRRDGRPIVAPPPFSRGGFDRLEFTADGRFAGDAWIDVAPEGPGLAEVRTWLDGAPGAALAPAGREDVVDAFGCRRFRYRFVAEGRTTPLARGAHTVLLTATERDGARGVVAGEIVGV